MAMVKLRSVVDASKLSPEFSRPSSKPSAVRACARRGQRACGRHHGVLVAHQQRVVEDLAQPLERRADRGLRLVHADRGARDAALGDQRAQHAQQVGLERDRRRGTRCVRPPDIDFAMRPIAPAQFRTGPRLATIGAAPMPGPRSAHERQRKPTHEHTFRGATRRHRPAQTGSTRPTARSPGACCPSSACSGCWPGSTASTSASPSCRCWTTCASARRSTAWAPASSSSATSSSRCPPTCCCRRSARKKTIMRITIGWGLICMLSLGHDADAVLHPALPAGRVRGRLLSRHDPVPHLLVSRRAARQGLRHLHVGLGDRRRAGRAAGRLDHELAWAACTAGPAGSGCSCSKAFRRSSPASSPAST